MATEKAKYPWWVRPTGGNRGWALVLAVGYTLLFVVDGVAWLSGRDWFFGALAFGFLSLAVFAWAGVIYLNRRSDGGGRRGW